MSRADKLEKSIYEYDNYRQFLRDFYEHSRQADSKFSFRYFAKLAGFQSPNYLKLVMDGRRNLALPGIEKCAVALKFNEEEKFFFTNLVLLNQATSIDEKQEYAAELLSCKGYKKLHPLQEHQFIYLTKWYMVPIREMVNWRQFKEDPEWIAKHLCPPISSEEAKEALETLFAINLLKRDTHGNIIQAESHLSTGDEVTGAYAAQFHREMMIKAAESIDLISRDKREISAITLGITEKNIKIVKDMVQQFRKDLLEVAGQEQGSTRIYQLNLQFFPLAALFEEDIFK
ncbi:MAG: TIGR02147 family protein [Bdellovibrio sp.]